MDLDVMRGMVAGCPRTVQKLGRGLVRSAAMESDSTGSTSTPAPFACTGFHGYLVDAIALGGWFSRPKRSALIAKPPPPKKSPNFHPLYIGGGEFRLRISPKTDGTVNFGYSSRQP